MEIGIAALIIMGLLFFTGVGCTIMSIVSEPEHKPQYTPVPKQKINVVKKEEKEEEPLTAIYDDFFEMNDDLLE